MKSHAASTQVSAGVPMALMHYEFQSCLGEGGFGQVFAAWDSKLRRNVAIKRLKHRSDAMPGGDLLKEAQLAASLQHAAFVKIYALEDDDDSQSIVMELVRGQTVKQLLASGPLDARQACDIVRQIAEAMQEAHDADLIHGDLKPSNLMLDPSGAVRILDFGLAAQGDAAATTSLMHADPQGTIAYMAPERLLGVPLRRQSDIYALGVILYELLTGARPFAELSGLALAAAHMQSSSAQWPFPADLSPALVQLVWAMTAKESAQRLQDMRQVCVQLAAGASVAAAPQPVSGARAPVPMLVSTPALAGRRWLRVLALVLACGALAAGGWQFLNRPAILSAATNPFSEAAEMQAGMEMLRLSDRPGSLDRAAASFNAILAHNPKNAAAVAGLAVTYFFHYKSDQQDEIWLQKADASAQQAYQLNDQLAITHAATSLVLGAHGRWELALAASARALTLDPSNLFALIAQLDALLGLRRFEEAKSVAELAMKNFPKERLFVDILGEAAYQQGDYQAAERAFRHSIALQPDAVFAYANLFAALSWQNRQDEGMKVLQQGLQIRPSPLLYGNLGNALFVRGDYLAAAAAFERAVSADGGDPADYQGWANLADTLLWIPGRAAEARAAYQKASDLLAPRLAWQKNDFTLISKMGLYCARTGKKAEAEDLMQRAVSLAPKNAKVYFRAGLAHELLGSREIALQEIEKAIALGYPVKLIEAEPDLLALRRDAHYLKH
jgi:serine/threonine-protein kinase